MIELNVSNRRFVKYFKKLISCQYENIFAHDADLIDATLSLIVGKNEYALLYSALIVFAVFLSDFLWHSLLSRNRWSVSVSLSFRDARQRASLLVYTLFEDSRSSSSMRVIICFFLRNIFV